MKDESLKFWHRRLGHLNVKSVHIFENMVSGMNFGEFSCPTSSLLCKACIERKQHRVAFPNNRGAGEEASDQAFGNRVF